MATSKILYMKDCGSSYHGKHLKVALDYIMDREKTQEGRLIGGVNCMPEVAFLQMRNTKAEFGKIDKRQAYHLIISFQEEEVDADTAFELTERFVKEYLSDRYEAVYAVHDNTAHIHSHIVFNSVSFVDGRKYRYEKGDWAREIQPITNLLCEEYGLSTIEIETDRVKPQGSRDLWDDYRNGPFVWADMVRRDLDLCIVQAESFEQFLQMLCQKGYEVKQGKHLAVKPQGMTRFKRCRSLGEDYTKERIMERIRVENLRTYRTETLDDAERIIYSQIPGGRRANLTGLQKKYYARLYRIGLLKRKPYSQMWNYKDEIRQMHRLQEQYLFLMEHDIENEGQLRGAIYQLEEKKKQASAEKRRVYRTRKKCEDLFSVEAEMKNWKEAEDAYQRGEHFFEEEHELWTQAEQKLRQQGYTYEEVLTLKEHFRAEAARVRKLELAAEKKVRIAESILKELTEDAKQKEQQKEKMINKEKSSR
ncbi:MAG: relaxase/mobilization nuclease domain-containing protein [Lachnospiraceae bacterium]